MSQAKVSTDRVTFSADVDFLGSHTDILVLNTCGFIEPAKKEAQNAIQEAVSLKKKKNEKKVIVVGCYVERYKSSLEQKYPEIDAWLGVNDFDKIISVIKGETIEKAKKSFLKSA